MKLSVKSDYAARAVLGLARHYPEGVAQRVVGDDEVDAGEGHGAPEDGGDGLHADGEGVLAHVARVREGVFLPQLAEDVRLAGHVEGVVGEVAWQASVSTHIYNE